MKKISYRNPPFVFVICFFVISWGCQEENPVEGFYASANEYYAVIMDSTLFLIYNPDTAIVYQLNTYKKFDSEIFGDDINMSSYHVNFKYNLTMTEGYYSGPFECPFPFNHDSVYSVYGGTLMAWFSSEDININGITFEKVEDSLRQKIYAQWENLVFRNEISLNQRMHREN